MCQHLAVGHKLAESEGEERCGANGEAPETQRCKCQTRRYSWPLPTMLCPIWIYLDVLFSTASIMHLCAISLDRYIAIRNPIHHSRFNSRTKAFLKIMAVWTISVGCSQLSAGLRAECEVSGAGSRFVLIGSLVAFFVPLTIMVVTYFLTISALQTEATLCLDQLVPRPRWAMPLGFLPHGSLSSEKLFFRRSLSGRGQGPGAGPPFGRRTMQSISNEQKASKVLGVVFFLFVVMWCPFFITNVLVVVCRGACDPAVMGGLLNVFVWVGYLSSAVNPLVYTLFNKTYRSAFARYIRCRYREERRSLQLILVNTIPPLAYSSTQLPLDHIAPLRNRDPAPQSSGCSGPGSPRLPEGQGMGDNAGAGGSWVRREGKDPSVPDREPRLRLSVFTAKSGFLHSALIHPVSRQ
ncbi:hypothetical protein JZ751_012700 [Albula glossodonta]|uniref:5-hydroxytryptamine receptor 2A n=1 Tax=Albula glossodonta TaxID=121402 RepID=A0A8T2N1S6_9TELE|nr:hypothetical protein JZ751_012700 [Albula glossodonta]